MAKPSHLQPWKAHARRLAGAGRQLCTVAAQLTEFYGFTVTRAQVRYACREMRFSQSAAIDNEGTEITGTQRGHIADRAEGWLAGNDPDYAHSRRQWQQPRSDALARMRDSGDVHEIADRELQIGGEEESGPHVGGTARPFQSDEEG